MLSVFDPLLHVIDAALIEPPPGIGQCQPFRPFG
jgi:hypothetical protein